ncbi:intracellular growth attenuator family protein [Motilimonas cestriensis]|uniref:Intracellular growth attenuator family protein n=1 Tax=Motilimonas cestriensis TaxID=2742685 RepID=A0ABS8WC07_9GAMM|nr:IgaA/UmoB family intracellular growth attenuator [Motilimonas cestriensis]MCE2595832.1 intracellular growth attenuator family protein [Motilimonas cestriensis]
MAVLAFIVSIVIIVCSLSAHLSFSSGKRAAKAKLNSLGQNTPPKRDMTLTERSALKDKFGFEPSSTEVYEIYGEVSGSTLTNNGVEAELFFTLGGYLVNIPETARPYLQVGDNIAEVAHENDSTWLISLNEVWHVTEDVAEQQMRDLNSEKIDKAEVGQLEESDIEILGKREATPTERQQLKPYSWGIGSMITVLLIMGLFTLLFDPFSPGLAVGVGLLLLPLSYWLFRRIRGAYPTSVSITKMSGKIYGVEFNGDHIRVHFQPPQLTMASSYSYIAPAHWLEPLAEQAQNFVKFEVYPESEKLVSIGRDFSLSAEQPKPKPQFARHISMLIAVLIFFKLVWSMVDMPVFNASLAHLWHERQLVANGVSELLAQQPQVGDGVVLSGPRQCIKGEAHNWDNAGFALCQRFYLLDRALPTISSTEDSVEQTKLAFINSYNKTDLTPQLNSMIYLRLQLVMLQKGEHIAAKSDTRGLDGSYFTAMTELFTPVCDYSKHCPEMKEALIEQWQQLLAELDEPSTCFEYCWQQMVAGEHADAYLIAHKRDTYKLEQAMASVYNDIRQQLIDIDLNRPQPEPAVLVRLTTDTQAPEKIGELYDDLSRRFSIKALTTYREYLNAASHFSGLEGIIIAIETTEQGQVLVLETDLTKQDLMQQWLILGLLVVLLGLALMHIARIVWLKAFQPE